MFVAAKGLARLSPRACGAIASRNLSVTFTLKTFVDEFTTEEVKITAEEGKTVLEVAQDNGATINAFCGGNCHCGGCQIKLSQYLTDRIPRPTDKEKEVLKKCVDVDESSRLACQTKVNKAMEGRVIVVPLAI
ncbi:Ferredoxin [Blastocystis sp. ATCC 50177/Nand II]|uniref:Ferredoxin n=1 Tax=Blastocystis sp. subtype 1 (strain ATCC 50177 / NandII) TaxID=478820 RepID=A0A196SL69_BLAHN|nr:Ferredoxin [Blastocystis sp. ATCC 50177/Nand II]